MTDVLKHPWPKWNKVLEEMDNKALIAFVEANRAHLETHTQPYVDNIFSFSVDKAVVDFIEVSESFRGQGIGGMLYEAMAHYLDTEHGLTLSSSSIQSDEARRCWDKLEHQGLAKTLDSGRKLFVGGVRQSTLKARDILPNPAPTPTVQRRTRVGMA